MRRQPQPLEHPIQPPAPAYAAIEAAGNSTLMLLLLAHLQQHGLLDAPAFASMVQKAETNAERDTPQLAGSAVVAHTLAWLHANSD